MTQTQITYRRRKTKFVKLFTATPAGVACPHFYVLSTANGCLYDCEYCYLRYTMRHWLTRGRPTPTVFTNLDDMKEQLLKWMRTKIPSLLNAGELADSFLDTKYLKVLFGLAHSPEFKKHLVLLLTKGGKDVVKALRDYPALDNFIVSFSVSTNAGAYEPGAPPVMERLEAARELKEKGWRIRLRIDPLLSPGIGGPVAPDGIIQTIVEMSPERITLGSLRFSPGWSYEHALRRATSESDRCGSNGRPFKMRLPYQQRKAMYYEVIQALRNHGYKGEVGLCKEVRPLHTDLGFDPENPLCNCAI